MEIIKDIRAMQDLAEKLRNERKRIAFVPTMGYLHDGHLSLMRYGREIADVLVISIFVNPAQFGPGEDFQQYPRDFERDSNLAREVGVDVIFTTSAEDIYHTGYQTYVEVEKVTKTLCGKSRPGHFRGVTTIVAKLFNIVKPHVAIFGEKDFQQLVTIKTMVRDLNIDVKIIGRPIVRESDGLAMSSRNTYLSKDERESALSLHQSLLMAQQMVEHGKTSSDAIINKVREKISNQPFTQIDYVQICDPENLVDVDTITGEALLALAVKVGETRLIDNCILNSYR